MPVLPATPASIARAAALLCAGGVVAFPTETVYGLGARAFDARAVARIFEIKRRPSFDPLIVHVLDEAMLERVAEELPASARALMERFWPGPLTLLLRKRPSLPGIVTAGLPSVAVRMPSHPVVRELLERTNEPLAAPSANPFGSLSPTRAEHVASALGESADLILDGGPSQHGIESTIVALEPALRILRLGAITPESLEAVVGPLGRTVPETNEPIVPGSLPQHYAPNTPLRVADVDRVPRAERKGAGALRLSRPAPDYSASRVLSANEDMVEAAAVFFEALHDLDRLGLSRIDAEPLPETGLGAALMDRLRRAERNS